MIVSPFHSLVILSLLASARAGEVADNPLQIPPPGAHELRLIAPSLLELRWITTKRPDPAPLEQWSFIDKTGRGKLPEPADFVVRVGDRTNAVRQVGFKRRVRYAPLKQRDLRIGNSLYLQLDWPATESLPIKVRNRGGKLWPANTPITVKPDPLRLSPAIHVNQVGYLPAESKKAFVGYYIGSMGELDVETATAGLESARKSSANSAPRLEFTLLSAQTGTEVFRGDLAPRRDRGFPFTCYQRVLEADFSRFQQPGNYRLAVAGLGTSHPFAIGEGVAGVFARSYALGIYHQRCGTDNALPFTRFTHGACHTAPAAVPNDGGFEFVNHVLAEEAAGAETGSRRTAPALNRLDACLYPFVNRGPVDVSGGHHDAGDYGKYTANSAAFIHFLVYAADNFPGAGELDNLGIPESGDGKSDLLQEAKWEADFLAKMQDADGGFYFLVYPRNRRYENDVTPDRGDPQVVFPKTTSVTAAATAALAQCASSPRFRTQFPDAAAQYLQAAKSGWSFLQRAIARNGRDGSYQRITHYSDQFMHDDELAWAACELFLATGETQYQDQLTEGLDPADPRIRRWGWWRLFDAYGNAIRSYAFAVKSGRLTPSQLRPLLLDACQAEVAAAGRDELRRALDSAYGTSFPDETKRTRTAGWYFSSDAAFDLAAACQLDFPSRNDPRPQMLAALLSNLNYEAGCNPVNVACLTGIGFNRQHEIVHQYAQNDRRRLPPSGIPIGNLQSGFGWLDHYGKELGALTCPADDDPRAPYPIYDRWGDSFNLSTEFVIVNQARALGYLAWLMARTPLKHQPWRALPARINGLPTSSSDQKTLTLNLVAPGLNVDEAQIIWEATDQEPVFAARLEYAPRSPGHQWVEAEALWPDGRRVCAQADWTRR